MAFYVGQKVVCVKADDPRAPPPRVEKGEILTVSETFHDGVEEMLQFVERRYEGGWFNGMYWAPGFQATSFRPVVERKTDISIFKAMLNPSKQEVSA